MIGQVFGHGYSQIKEEFHGLLMLGALLMSGGMMVGGKA